jgi:Ribonuclease G/E
VTVRILAETSPGEVRVAAVDGTTLVDYAIWRPGAPDGVGDLHRGRVTARVPAMAGAFVALDGAEGFLPDSQGGAGVRRSACASPGPRRAARGRG